MCGLGLAIIFSLYYSFSILGLSSETNANKTASLILIILLLFSENLLILIQYPSVNTWYSISIYISLGLIVAILFVTKKFNLLAFYEFLFQNFIAKTKFCKALSSLCNYFKTELSKTPQERKLSFQKEKDSELSKLVKSEEDKADISSTFEASGKVIEDKRKLSEPYDSPIIIMGICIPMYLIFTLL